MIESGASSKPSSGAHNPRAVFWPAGDSRIAVLMRAHGWLASSLGATEDWPQSLRSAVDLALGCRYPMIVLWGNDLVQIYNDAYRELMGNKHPAGLGQPTQDCWPEVWKINEPIYARVLAGETLTFEDQLYPITRHGYVEDAYFTLCYSPLRNEAGEIKGVLVTVFETTKERRARTAVQASEAGLKELFEQAPAFVAVLRGPDHVFEMANPLYQELVGHREVLGKSVATALPEAEEQGFIGLLDMVYRTGEAFRSEGARISLTRDGEKKEDRFLDLVYQPLREAENTVSGIIVLGVDVTEVRQNVDALAVTEAELRWRLELNPHNPWTADPQGRIIDFSTRWLALTGLSEEQAHREGWRQVPQLENLSSLQRSWKAALESGEPLDVEHRIQFAGEESRWMRSRALPRRSADGQIVCWYGSTEDIHDHKMAERALLQSEKLAAVGRLASSIAHEINNPLEAVTNLLYLARTEPDEAKMTAYIEAAQAELQRVSHHHSNAPIPQASHPTKDRELYRSRRGGTLHLRSTPRQCRHSYREAKQSHEDGAVLRR